MRNRDLNKLLESSKVSLTEMLKKQNELAEIALAELSVKETLVVTIDMNKGFAKAGALYSPRVEAICGLTGEFISACDRLGYKIAAFSDCHEKGAAELASYPEHCMQGTEEPLLIDELSSLQGSVKAKNCTNAFLAADINWADYKNVIVTGCCTDICIYQFAVTLKCFYNQNDISARVIVPLELVETYDAPWHNADLLEVVFVDSMMSNGVEVVRDIKA